MDEVDKVDIAGLDAVVKHVVDRKRPGEQRIVAVGEPEHGELPGHRPTGNWRAIEANPPRRLGHLVVRHDAGTQDGGLIGMTIALLGSLPLALFTRYFLERRHAALNDVVAFFKLGNRSKLRMHLLAEGERLQEEIQRTVEEIMPKL